MFRRLVTDCDLLPVRFHDLRHGAASLSLAAGNDLKTVQALLGTTASCGPPTRTPACCLPGPSGCGGVRRSCAQRRSKGVQAARRGRSKPIARKQLATRPRQPAAVALSNRIMSPHGTHTRSTPTGKIHTIVETCWSASIPKVCTARVSTPNPLVRRVAFHQRRRCDPRERRG